MKTTQDIADFVEGTLHGNPTEQIHGIGSLEHAEAGTVTYAETKYLDRVSASRATCVLVQSGEFPGRTVVVVDNPRVAFARVAQWLKPAQRPFDGIHATALVANPVGLADDVAIGAWTVVEEGACIGRSTVIFPGCYIGRDCRVGANCVIYPGVVLYPGVLVRDRVIVHAGVVIGADGFGFVFDGERHLKIPQIGHVTIQSEVEVGANSCIDRGALDETVVHEGVKIDNLCQIAHNVQVGRNAIISSQTGVAGSSRVGNHAVIGGQVGIADYCRVDDHAQIGAQCGVPSRKRIPAGEVYWGTPARPLKDIKLQQAHLSRLPSMTAELKQLRKELDELRNKLG